MKLTFFFAAGLAIVPALIFSFFGELKTTRHDKEKGGFLVYAGENPEGFVLKLSGEMEFYWDQLLTPDDFSKKNIQHTKTEIDFPKTWNGKTVNGKKLPGRGCATYRATLCFDTICPMAIRVSDYCNAYKMWMNGKLISEAGKPGKSKAETVPVKINAIAGFTPLPGTNELIFQTANYNEKYGGFRQPFLIGTFDEIKSTDNKRVVIDAFVLGLLLLTFLYNLGFYLFNPRKKSFLFFALLVLFLFLRLGLISNIKLFDHFFQQQIYLYLKTTIALAWVSSLMLLQFSRAFFPKMVSKKLANIYAGWVVLVCLFVFAAPYYYVSVGNQLLQYVMLAMLAYLFILLMKGFFKRNSEKFLIATGLVLFILFVVAEALIYNRLYYSGYVLQYGLVFFILFESYALGVDFSATYRQNMELTKELETQNLNLQNMVEEKTKEAIDAKEREMLSTMIQKAKSDKLLKKVSSQIGLLKLDNKKNKAVVNEVMGTINASFARDENEQQFLHFRKVHPRFFEILQAKYPFLSPNELKLCAYIKLNLSQKEIADILNVQPESVRKSKQRLRRKMGLSSDKDLYQLLIRL
ncbi:MAG: LuxR C-terminal-related transcriptional regulator [Prolixibacteraceae bacterium]|nr:LuxR C-terminal-related transcriptional regulator [Prolixibacteraceae bacterium]